MANNLKKFATDAEYSAATLNYPAVSWVVSGDTVHFDKTAPTPTVNDKVIMGFSYKKQWEDEALSLYNHEGTSPSTYFSSITVNDVAVNPITDEVQFSTNSNVYNIVKYGITTTEISDCFAFVLSVGGSDTPNVLEMLIPSQITDINSWLACPLDNLIILPTTPPSTLIQESSLQWRDNAKIYVPDESVNAYKSDAFWNFFASMILPLSDYQGNLPV